MAFDLEKEMQSIIKDYSKELRADIEKALTASGGVLISKLEAASPTGESVPHFKESWGMKTKYQGVRYVGNTKTIESKKGNIPLSNILEYGPYAKPFIAKTFNLHKEEIYRTFVNTLKGGV